MGNRRLHFSVLAAAFLLAFAGAGCRKAGQPASAPQTRPGVLTTQSGSEMVLIPAGEFVMGDEAGADDEKPARRVRVRAFYMDRCEVTQEAYEALVGRNPAKFRAPDRPVERVSWHAAAKFCNLRSMREGLQPCYDARTFRCNFDADGYRLPTEAEWEYACRAGSTDAYTFGTDAGALGDHAWFQANSVETTHPVGQRKPNAWGLYDMHGNVAEWCNDFYDEAYYRQGGPADPRGPAKGADRVLRGGNWRSTPDACRSAARSAEEPGFADVCFGYEAYGFRCVRSAPAEPKKGN